MNKYSSGYALMQMLSLLGVLVIVCSVGLGIFIFAMNDRLSEFVGITAIIYGGFSGLVLMGMGAIGGAILDGSVSQQNTEREIARLVKHMVEDGDNVIAAPKYSPVKKSIDNSLDKIKNYKGYDIYKKEIFL